MKWVAHPHRGHSEFWFCGWNRQELLARIAGSLATARLNILSADVFTRADSLVFDIFRVCNTKFAAVTDEKDMTLVAKRLQQALEEEHYDFASLHTKLTKLSEAHLVQELDFPTRIGINNDAHPVYTRRYSDARPARPAFQPAQRVQQERCADCPLQDRHGKGAAIDTFYVSDAQGHKLHDAGTITRLQKALHGVSTVLRPRC